MRPAADVRPFFEDATWCVEVTTVFLQIRVVATFDRHHASAGKLQLAVSLPWHVLRCTQNDRQAYPDAVAVLIEALYLLAETLCLTLKKALDALHN
jgi:hypothetical protein